MSLHANGEARTVMGIKLEGNIVSVLNFVTVIVAFVGIYYAAIAKIDDAHSRITAFEQRAARDEEAAKERVRELRERMERNDRELKERFERESIVASGHQARLERGIDSLNAKFDRLAERLPPVPK